MTAFDKSLLGRAGLSQMRRNRDVLFYSLNAFGWLAWGVGQQLGFSVYAEPAQRDKPFYAVALTAITIGFLLTSVMRYACRWLWKRPPATLIFGSIVLAYLTAIPMRIVINASEQYFFDSDYVFKHWYEWFMGVMYGLYLLIGWMGIYFSFHFYEANLRERETSLRAMSLAQAAQLKMLRYQLNPHFLFNTLNAISTLVLDSKNAIANTVVTRLADFLRYTLDQDPMKTVTLTQEITALNLYLDIEKMRFGDRLKVTIDIDPAAGEVAVPSLLLQPLIENAIKYAVSPSEAGGTIGIRAWRDAGTVTITVSDNGPGLSDMSRIDSGRGVGLRNTRERLVTMYGDQGRVDFSNAAPGLRITLNFPARSSGGPPA